ncbi:uncharacterized protein BXZ73DRAFT_43210 [Epithele typhae]|uniref:uncharacterized protein n=1 Tax=Epithele typhae TaxID=378194 RepID=UPI0020076E81|nr:uncharacterized protein BXZ73DRAFT_43210 [Epithele typhae]KAH9940221.1 hypothetical protein BXZ73DRAFT_43210 [Epithele typhae]
MVRKASRALSSSPVSAYPHSVTGTSSVSSESTACSSATETPGRIWFEDGNVVVIAQNSSFRVNEGILGHRSREFRRLIKEARRANRTGVELRVSDSSHDFEHLLRILYEGFEYTKAHRPTTFSDLASATRLAHKYTISSVLDQSFERLRTFFPSTLDEWDEHEALRAPSSPSFSPQNAIEAVILFRSLPPTSPAVAMLPTALYLAAQVPPALLFRGTWRADGTLEKLGDHAGVAEEVLTLHTSLIRHAVAAHSAVYDGAPKAGLFHSCGAALERAEKDFRQAAVHGDPLSRALRDEIEGLAGDKYKICEFCVKELRRREREYRMKIWGELRGVIDEESPDKGKEQMADVLKAEKTAGEKPSKR